MILSDGHLVFAEVFWYRYYVLYAMLLVVYPVCGQGLGAFAVFIILDPLLKVVTALY